MDIQIGQIITDEWIDKVAWEIVHVNGYQNWTGSENCINHYTCDGDEGGSFCEAMEHAHKDHFAIWERNHEDKDVESHIVEWTRGRLEDDGFIDGWKYQGNPLTCAYGELFKPVKISELNIEQVYQCITNAEADVTWSISESLQVYFQTLNPCSWDGKPPKERYGKDWVEDTETRLFLMLHKDRLNAEVYKRLTRHNYRSVLRGTDGDIYEVKHNEEENYFIY